MQLNQFQKTREVNTLESSAEILSDFIYNRHLPIAVKLLVNHLGKDFIEWIAEHTDSSERVLVWHMTSDLDYCYSFDSLGFPTKEEFIQDLNEPVKTDFEHSYGDFIRSSTPDDHAKIVIFTEFVREDEERTFLNVGQISLV